MWDPSGLIPQTFYSFIIHPVATSPPLIFIHQSISLFKTPFPSSLCVTLRAAGDKSESTLHDANEDGVRARGRSCAAAVARGDRRGGVLIG